MPIPNFTNKEELLNLHRGQGLELLWRDSLQCPTEEEYIGMVNNSMCMFDWIIHTVRLTLYSETGGLFRLAIKLMMACATESRDM